MSARESAEVKAALASLAANPSLTPYRAAKNNGVTPRAVYAALLRHGLRQNPGKPGSPS